MAVIGRIAGIDGTGQTHAFFAMIVDGAQISVFTQVACGRRCDATSAGITRIVRAGIPVITNLGGSDTGTRLAAVRDRADLSIIAREVFKIRWMSTHTRITDVFRADVLVVITIRRIAQRRAPNPRCTGIVGTFIAIVAVHREARAIGTNTEIIFCTGVTVVTHVVASHRMNAPTAQADIIRTRIAVVGARCIVAHRRMSTNAELTDVCGATVPIITTRRSVVGVDTPGGRVAHVVRARIAVIAVHSATATTAAHARPARTTIIGCTRVAVVAGRAAQGRVFTTGGSHTLVLGARVLVIALDNHP